MRTQYSATLTLGMLLLVVGASCAPPRSETKAREPVSDTRAADQPPPGQVPGDGSLAPLEKQPSQEGKEGPIPEERVLRAIERIKAVPIRDKEQASAPVIGVRFTTDTRLMDPRETLADLHHLRALDLSYTAFPNEEDDPFFSWVLGCFPQLETLDLPRTGLSSGTYRALRKCHNLRELTAIWSKVNDDNLQDISKIRSLEVLKFSGFVTESGLEYLTALPNLRVLEVIGSGAGITDRGAARLSRLRKLKVLGLSSTKITDDGLKQIARLTELESLSLFNAKISDAGLKYLKALTRLRTLDLSNTPVTGAGVSSLIELPNLEELNLAHIDIQDAHVGTLAKLRGLKTLDVRDTPLTPAGVAALRKAMPDTEILSNALTPQ